MQVGYWNVKESEDPHKLEVFKFYNYDNSTVAVTANRLFVSCKALEIEDIIEVIACTNYYYMHGVVRQSVLFRLAKPMKGKDRVLFTEPDSIKNNLCAAIVGNLITKTNALEEENFILTTKLEHAKGYFELNQN